MEYFVSFVTFFVIYSGANLLVEPIRRKYLVKNLPEKTGVNKKNNKNNKNSKTNRSLSDQETVKKITKKDIIGILKNSLVVSFIYVFVIFILKRFS